MKRSGPINYVNHLTNMREIFSRFVEASGITDYESLFDQMLMEQFLASLPAPVRSFVHTKEPKTSLDCARFADLSHEVDKLNKETTNDRNPHTSSQLYNAGSFVGPQCAAGRQFHGPNQRSSGYMMRPSSGVRAYQGNYRAPIGQQPRINWHITQSTGQDRTSAQCFCRST